MSVFIVDAIEETCDEDDILLSTVEWRIRCLPVR